jgi:hypothetical protein
MSAKNIYVKEVGLGARLLKTLAFTFPSGFACFAGKSVFVSLLLWASRVLAGDAVAIGYNKDGVWTSVTYYSSGKPKGGKDYKTEAEAREAATRDLQKRDVVKGAWIEILSSSDMTGFVAVGRGVNAAGKDENVVGRGQTQKEADEKALDQLKAKAATKNQKIVYRFFSHGSDGK